MRRDDDAGNRGQGRDAHVGEHLDAYRTGELNEAGRARVDAHLAECERCREELAALASWTSAIERGYEARRAGSAGLEPDWAAQRAAIVARTSGRAHAGGGRGVFRRWAPQIALVAVAALIVGIVWRENPREPTDVNRPAQSGRAGAESEQKSDAVETREPGGAEKAVEGEDALGRATARTRRADEPAAAPTPGPEEGFAQENAAAIEKEAGRDADESGMDRREALADRVAEPTPAAPLGAYLADVERFERDARAALEARDTTGARRALALWGDTLAARGDLADGRAALADSLRKFLEAAE